MENILQHPFPYVEDTYESKKCWICLETDDDDDNYEFVRYWVSPCKCHGSTRWVHQHCINRWFEEKLRENRNVKVHCPQCQTEYILAYDEINYLVQLLNKLDNIANRICPSLAVFISSTFLCWTAVSYGVMTMMQVMGKIETLNIMTNTDVYLLILVLPTIPLSLILSKIINWEETSRSIMQRFIRLPLLRTIMPSFFCEPVNNSTYLIQFNQRNSFNSLFDAILLPTTASLIGKLLFKNSSYSSLQKSILGGLLYISLKGVFGKYQKYHNLMKTKSRKIINYPDTDTDEDY